jgi:chromosome segregation protein
MRLQRLEIAGFKSFPDRSELTFDTGVTAIVGPNGCGKSNVVDALTWVLGEQSAKSLRGDRMEDVIFGGSDGRKPTAAAEVRLKLAGVAARVPGAAPRSRRTTLGQSNGDGNGNGNNGGAHAYAAVEPAEGGTATGVLEPVPVESSGVDIEETPLIVRDVELMRRLYRSGESEYLIDGETCRLRDVQDLLMDAGLGVKAYAVIEQGKIGQILSARPTDRRQLIEEAAGVTKYKSRRRAAELKLEAAQQNLTRVDDIIYEVEKQRGTLKRQAAKARRYKRLRDELRRWEKVQFAQRYRRLGEAIESTRGKLADARAREGAAAAHLAEVEATVERLRLDLTDADSQATASREAAHARELEIGRLQQQIALDRQQIETLASTATEIGAEVAALVARREPAQMELNARAEAASRAAAQRESAAGTFRAEASAYADLQRNIESLEADVEAARSEVFAAVNAATALRHALEHTTSARTRIGEQLAKLEVETNDLNVEIDRAMRERAAAVDALVRARESIEALTVERAARETELAGARAERDARASECRAHEQELASIRARLNSLEELDAGRAHYGDGARLVLAEAEGRVRQMGSVADYLDVEPRYERAVAACVGDLLQHVVVATHEDAAAGLHLAREQQAGRVGFLVVEGKVAQRSTPPVPGGVRRLSQVVRVTGPAATAIEAELANAWVADSLDAARWGATQLPGPVATIEGDVFRRGNLVEGGQRSESVGLLSMKREIKELRERVELETSEVERLHQAGASIALTIAAVESALVSLQAELHRQEKGAVGFELQVAAAAEASDRLGRKRDQIATERRSADEELRTQEARRDEAQESIARIELDQRAADEQLNGAQRRLFEAREAMEAQSQRTAEAKAEHAALVERASALEADVARLEAAGRELEARLEGRRADLARAETRGAELREGVKESELRLDSEIRDFAELKDRVRQADERARALRADFEEHEAGIREARRSVEAVRAEVASLDVARATAEADLNHLAASCVETVQATLDEVAAEVTEMEGQGLLASPVPVEDAPDAAEIEGDDLETKPDSEAVESAAPAAASKRAMTADEMVADLRQKIERMGAVNMMAIDQFDDLESRHAFLTTQRKDLVDSIAATGEAIRRIDKTTKERFRDAFTVINENFGQTFRTLFGGGQAGLVLLDESDQLESGIDIIAQPPGKRLQSVQLLSGGEKALTAMALMFAIFKYRPSPFCLLDEIDAPLDDANIGRFVEMLQGMQDQTQFILITHNRKTMEIANRLYGVTMEEPGVSKLISVQLN